MNKRNTWLYDENGEVRKELYTQSKAELDEKQVEVLANQESHNPACTDRAAGGLVNEKFWPATNPALRALKRGDVIYVKPTYSVASQFGGRMTFIAFSGVAGGSPPSKCMFCRTEDGGGGFIGADMLVNPEKPTKQPDELLTL